MSQDTSFDPEIGLETDGTYGSGHDLLQKKAREMVDQSILLNKSRWAGIGKQSFPPNTGEDNSQERYQVQRPSGTENLDQSTDGGTTRFGDYQHKTGNTNSASQSTIGRTKFWDGYFNRLGLVGAKITLGATGRDLPTDKNKIGNAPMGILKQGLLDESDLRAGYGK